MKLIIGLGNPGDGYVDTRHNAGFLVADELQKVKLPNGVIVRKSDVFMNDSGMCVNELIHRYKIEPSDLYIIHDDLDIPLGSYKIQFGVGPKDHNGINSVEAELGTKDFWRVRVGVDNRKPDDRIQGEEYVLQDFTKEERKTLDGVIGKICKEISSSLQ
ncbi:MAG: aminoacyl-tRNA hydrolase [Candidatus Woesebacteria bacterium]|nr:aminoacyl-tRNA hydrolase [Candidatus Woesebacteria bacterium]